MIVNPRVKDFAIVFLAGFALTAMYEAVRCHERFSKTLRVIDSFPVFAPPHLPPPTGNPAPVPPPQKESASR